MGVPRVDKTAKTAMVEHRGKMYDVKYVRLTAREEDECKDEASPINIVGDRRESVFKPFLFTQLAVRRMVTEIDGEPVHKDSHVWNEIDPRFMDKLRIALFPEEKDFFRGDTESGAVRSDG